MAGPVREIGRRIDSPATHLAGTLKGPQVLMMMASVPSHGLGLKIG
jgi:hypothetical protein